MFTDQSFYHALIIAAIIAFVIVAASALGLFVMWIKYSWIKRGNSKNYTGRDMTEALFKKNGMNLKIKSSFFYAKFWNNNKKRGTYKLRPWTHNRRSLWTMMEASQQAYATIIRDKQPKTFWTAFRLPQLISFGGLLIGIGFVAWGLAAAEPSTWNDLNWDAYVKVSVGITVFLLGFLYASVYRAYVLRKNVPTMLESTGITTEEIKIIKRIFTFALVYAIANAILQTIRLVLRVASKANNNNNN